MTHSSTFRYGYLPHEVNCGAKSGEVRVSYFDPETGEPCETKPKPRPGKPKTKNEERDIAIENARKRAEDIAKKAERRKPEEPANQAARYRRAVLVDGVRFESVAAAADEVGTTPEWLGFSLRNSRETCKGRKVKFAEGDE